MRLETRRRDPSTCLHHHHRRRHHHHEAKARTRRRSLYNQSAAVRVRAGRCRRQGRWTAGSSSPSCAKNEMTSGAGESGGGGGGSKTENLRKLFFSRIVFLFFFWYLKLSYSPPTATPCTVLPHVCKVYIACCPQKQTTCMMHRAQIYRVKGEFSCPGSLESSAPLLGCFSDENAFFFASFLKVCLFACLHLAYGYSSTMGTSAKAGTIDSPPVHRLQTPAAGDPPVVDPTLWPTRG